MRCTWCAGPILITKRYLLIDNSFGGLITDSFDSLPDALSEAKDSGCNVLDAVSQLVTDTASGKVYNAADIYPAVLAYLRK